jgi:hypothetical protein
MLPDYREILDATGETVGVRCESLKRGSGKTLIGSDTSSRNATSESLTDRHWLGGRD